MVSYRIRPSSIRVRRTDVRPVDLVDASYSRQRHRVRDLGVEDLQYTRHASLASGRQTPQIWPPHEHRAGAEPERDQHIGSTPDAPSRYTSARPLTPFTTSSSTSTVAGVRSSWRPP
jgi:hypothetical protein